MRDLIFNDLSELPLALNKTEAYKRVELFLQTFKKANEFKFNKIRSDKGLDGIRLSEGYSLIDYCQDSANRTRATLLYGLLRYPYIEEDSPEEERYVKEEGFFLEKNGQQLVAYSFATAYLYSSICIGFYSEAFWNNLDFELIIPSATPDIVTVLNAAKPQHFELPPFLAWLENNTVVQLIKSDLHWEQKKIKLREDHGKDILEKFARRVVKSPYVIEVINSLPFNSRERNFIRKVYPDGHIEIVLTKTDKGIGMMLKTTGRNQSETEKIAELLMVYYP